MQHDLTLSITGMTCASCVQSVEHLALKVKGVEHAAVNLPMARGRFTIEGEANDSIAEAIILAIEDGGFGAIKNISPKEQMEIERHRLKLDQRKVIVALLLAIPTFWLSMLAGDMGTEYGIDVRKMLAMYACVPVFIWSGWGIHKGAFASLKSGRANMDVLITLGTSVAFFWSVLVVLSPTFPNPPGLLIGAEHVFFDGVVVIIAFVLLGNWMEASAKMKATDAVHGLMALQPKVGRIVLD